MAEDNAPDTTVDEPDAPDTTTDGPDTTTDETPDKVDRSELDKVIAQRDKLKAKLRELDKPADPDKSEPDPADTLRAALRRTAATSVLVGRGITDKAQQEAVLSVMHLDTLDVGEDGSVDTDTLADTLDTLSRIFGKSDKPRPPKVDTRKGQGDSGSGKDSDSQRYERIMGRR